MARTQTSLKRMRISTNSKNGHHYIQHDFISQLPDDILLMILDQLPTEDVTATSLLSRRWKNLWKLMSNVDYRYQWVQKTGKKIVPSVNRFVRNHQGPKIKRFCVSLRYNYSMLRYVESWIAFAVEKNVEELYLDLNDRNECKKRRMKQYRYFQLPECIFSCSSLVKLTLMFLKIDLLPSIHLESLKELHFDRTELSDDAIQTITANCPVLELLLLSDCNRTQNLKVNVAPNSNLLHLIIKDGFMEVNHETDIVINAPKITTIEFLSSMPRKYYRIENALVGVEAKLSFDEMLYDQVVVKVLQYYLLGGLYDRKLQGLLNTFKTAKVLQLCSWCIQFLSVRKVMGQETLSLDSTHLVLYTGLQKWELPGIAYVLMACRRLENLVIVTAKQAKIELTDAFLRHYDFRGAQYWRNQDYSFAAHLRRLAVIEFKNTNGDYQTWENGGFDSDIFFTRYENGIELLRFLMRNSTNLERVIFTTNKKQHQICYHYID